MRSERLRFDERTQRFPVPARHLCPGADARARREREPCSLADLLEREGIELLRNLALEPGFVALGRMLARPTAITAMPCEIVSPRTRFTAAPHRGSLPATVCIASILRAASIARRPCSRRAFGMHASQ